MIFFCFLFYFVASETESDFCLSIQFCSTSFEDLKEIFKFHFLCIIFENQFHHKNNLTRIFAMKKNKHENYLLCYKNYICDILERQILLNSNYKQSHENLILSCRNFQFSNDSISDTTKFILINKLDNKNDGDDYPEKSILLEFLSLWIKDNLFCKTNLIEIISFMYYYKCQKYTNLQDCDENQRLIFVTNNELILNNKNTNFVFLNMKFYINYAYQFMNLMKGIFRKIKTKKPGTIHHFERLKEYITNNNIQKIFLNSNKEFNLLEVETKNQIFDFLSCYFTNNTDIYIDVIDENILLQSFLPWLVIFCESQKDFVDHFAKLFIENYSIIFLSFIVSVKNEINMNSEKILANYQEKHKRMLLIYKI